MSVDGALRLANPFIQADAPEGSNEGEDSDNDAERIVVLDSRPFGLELEAAQEDGRGAVVRRAEGASAAAGIEPGTALISINEDSVEDLHITDVEERLERVPLPVSLGVRTPLGLLSVLPRKPRKRDPVTVCTACCRGSYRVVSEALSQLGWQETSKEDRDASLVWLEHSDSTDGLAPVQTLSRIEAFLHFCRKATMANSLNPWLEELPEDFAFSPKTWVLPYDAADLEATMSRSKDVFIAKPSSGSQGKGILLVKKWQDLANVMDKMKNLAKYGNIEGREYVVQRYVADPLLLDGLKFDLRLYCIVTSVVPLRAYLFREGLARFCTVPYQPPKESNLADGCMHLTNYAVNKKSKDFQTTEGVDQHAEGSKRSASSVFRQIEEAVGVGADEMWNKMAVLCANTLAAMRPGLVEYYIHDKPKPLHPLGPKGFQIIGLDVLFDAQCEPILLELNANPSLSVTQPGANPTAEGGEEDATEEGNAATPPATPPLAPTPPGSAPYAPPIPPHRSPSPMPNSTSVTATRASSASRMSRPRGTSLRRAARLRLGLAGDGADNRTPSKQVVSELDLQVKRELVAQAMSVACPAPQSKVIRMKKMWHQRRIGSSGVPPVTEHVPLDDSGTWLPSAKQSKSEAVRPDMPTRCPALEVVDCATMAAASVTEYAQAHLVLYRLWRQTCGRQETLGPAPALKLLERMGLVQAGSLFQDRVTGQLWLSKAWREAAGAAFGLNLPQFVSMAGRLGKMMLNGGAEVTDDDEGPSHVQGVMEFVSQPGFAAVTTALPAPE